MYVCMYVCMYVYIYIYNNKKRTVLGRTSRSLCAGQSFCLIIMYYTVLHCICVIPYTIYICRHICQP